MLGRELPAKPTARPVPRVWARDGDVIVEYDIFLGGPLGFELVRETAKTIGVSPGLWCMNTGPKATWSPGSRDIRRGCATFSA
jgi:hypothetical protein